MKYIIIILLFGCTKENEFDSYRKQPLKGKNYYPKTITELNKINLNAGDSAFLSGNYNGNIIISANDAGGYIGGNASLGGTVGNGVLISASITIEGIEITGFDRGVLIQSGDVVLRNLIVHDNRTAGIESIGRWPQMNLQNIYIGYCKVYNNKGNLSTAKHSGNGILLGNVNGGTIEYCEAWNNGEDNRGPSGPIGIWMYDSKNVIIQFSKSHNNKAGLTKDGGGFGIDGGSQGCKIIACEAYDNEGAGYGLYEYGSPNPYTNNSISNSISRNDGTKNGYGALSLWSADGYSITNTEVFGNTFYGNGVQVIGGSYSNVSVYDNTFYGAVKNEPAIINFYNNQYN